jgi:hypothetical protein
MLKLYYHPSPMDEEAKRSMFPQNARLAEG